jgi:hypothetical protein
MEEAQVGSRFADRGESTAIDRADPGGGSRDCRLSATHASAAGRHTLLLLDDGLYALQAPIPHLTRSSLHRCLQRHGMSRPPETEGDKPAKKRFKPYRLLPHRHRRGQD